MEEQKRSDQTSPEIPDAVSGPDNRAARYEKEVKSDNAFAHPLPARPSSAERHTYAHTFIRAHASARLKRKWRVKLPKIDTSAASDIVETVKKCSNTLSPTP